ncbi:hypothetical protein BGZ82_010633, partial [Podila clonocystis]
MADNHLTLFCLVEGLPLARAFPIKATLTDTVGDLKDHVKAHQTPAFDDITSDQLNLWCVSISTDNQASAITIDAVDDKIKLNNPRTRLSNVFSENPDDNIYIIVQRPPQAPKREREEEAGPSSKKRRLHRDTLMDAIEEAGLTEKALVAGGYDLSLLDDKERGSLLGFIGKQVGRTDTFHSLSSTAFELQGASIKDMDTLSAPSGLALPVVETNDLYVRTAFKDLYDTILGTFEDGRPYDPDVRKHVVVTGTSGIGKSAFL